MKVKVVFGNDTRVFHGSESDGYESLVKFVADSFKFCDISNILLKYLDDESDKVTISNNDDLNDAFECAKSEKRESLKIFVSYQAKRSSSSQHQQSSAVVDKSPVESSLKDSPIQSSLNDEFKKEKPSNASDVNSDEWRNATQDFLGDKQIQELLPQLVRRIIGALRQDANANEDEKKGLTVIVTQILSEPQFKPIAAHKVYTEKIVPKLPFFESQFAMHSQFLLNMNEDLIAGLITQFLQMGANENCGQNGGANNSMPFNPMAMFSPLFVQPDNNNGNNNNTNSPFGGQSPFGGFGVPFGGAHSFGGGCNGNSNNNPFGNAFGGGCGPFNNLGGQCGPFNNLGGQCGNFRNPPSFPSMSDNSNNNNNMNGMNNPFGLLGQLGQLAQAFGNPMNTDIINNNNNNNGGNNGVPADSQQSSNVGGQPVISEEEAKQIELEKEKLRSKKMLCICGVLLDPVSPNEAYGNGGCICDICLKYFDAKSQMLVYHCPNRDFHDKGYDVCARCAQLQNDSFKPVIVNDNDINNEKKEDNNSNNNNNNDNANGNGNGKGDVDIQVSNNDSIAIADSIDDIKVDSNNNTINVDTNNDKDKDTVMSEMSMEIIDMSEGEEEEDTNSPKKHEEMKQSVQENTTVSKGDDKNKDKDFDISIPPMQSAHNNNNNNDINNGNNNNESSNDDFIYSSQLKQISEMGFEYISIDILKTLLIQHKGQIDRVIPALFGN